MATPPEPLEHAPPGLRPLLGTVVAFPLVVYAWASPDRFGGVPDPRWLPPLLWLAYGLLRRAGQGAPESESPFARVLRVWRRADPVLGAALIYAVLFRTPETVLFPLCGAGALAGALALLRRAPAPALVALLFAVLVFGVALPRAFRTLLLARVAATYDLSVDHRLIPDGREINSDSARFRGEAEDLADEDFVVLFFGDSFTFGFNLPYEAAYPYRFEQLSSEAGCGARVRAVDFGWTSASPLLGLRLLREVGYAYRPDLIVYDVDMTDFHDDLRYEYELRREGDFVLDESELFDRLVATQLPWLAGLSPLFSAIGDRLYAGGAKAEVAERGRLLAELEMPASNERYFVTAHPLEKTQRAIELGVMKNLADMHAFATDVLDARMLVVVHPRAYQYSARESPRNWESAQYERLGPWAKEPFRYFEREADTLPYPVLSLLPAFESTSEFPLYYANDPHWNERGAAFVAREIFRGAVALGLLPCR